MPCIPFLPSENHLIHLSTYFLCQSLFFDKVAGLRPETLLKNEIWYRCFSVNLAKFLRTSFFDETRLVAAFELRKWLSFFRQVVFSIYFSKPIFFRNMFPFDITHFFSVNTYFRSSCLEKLFLKFSGNSSQNTSATALS